MGFSGGGSNVLLPHTHDGTVSQDGGPLDFNNITQSQSAAGEVFYSDGAHLQQLAYPGVPAGETLTAVAASTAPAWVAGAGATPLYVLVGSTTLGGAASSIDVTFAAVDQVDISKIVAVFNGSKTEPNASLFMKVNSLGSNYDGGLIEQDSADPFGYGFTSNTRWTVHGNSAGDEFLINVYMTCNAVTDKIQAQIHSVSETRTTITRGYNDTAAQTSFTKVEFEPNTGNISAGSRLDVYKILLA
jgi:hypothetical protein